MTAPAATPSPAFVEARSRLKQKLEEVLQFDCEELDFGVYRILNVRREEFRRFLDTELDRAVAAQVGEGGGERARLLGELAKVEALASEMGVSDVATLPKWRELRAAVDKAPSHEELAREVFSLLTAFISRYYEDGDFLSRPRRGDAYVVPYDGKEVHLHWANADQYYVKSSEHFQVYDADVSRGARRWKLRLRLAQVESLEQDNVKAATRRLFHVRAERPVVVEGEEVTCYFEYREPAERVQQQSLRVEAEAAILAAVGAGPLREALAADAAGSSKRTTIGLHLYRYTERASRDFFIHHDLGKFLRQELDAFIKSEVLVLDDLRADALERATRMLQKVQALRGLAEPLIAWLAQIEDFQKRLWLKKKFVLENRFLVTLDRVPVELYPEIAGNVAQREAWVRLCAIDEVRARKRRGRGLCLVGVGGSAVEAYSVPLTVEFLKQNLGLMVDTRFFDAGFVRRLRASGAVGDVNGWAFRGENAGALRTMRAKWGGGIGFCYIDPPYNTGGDGFSYKDGYQHSSWCSMIAERFVLSRHFLQPAGAMFVSIDEIEQPIINGLAEREWGQGSVVANLVWSAGRKNDSKLVSVSHEYIVAIANDRSLLSQSKVTWKQRKKGLDDIYARFDSLTTIHGSNFDKIRSELKLWYKELPDSHPSKAHKHYSQIDGRGIYFAADLSWPGGGGPRYQVLHPLAKKPVKIPSRGWIYATPERMNQAIDEDMIHFGLDESSVPCAKSYLRDREYQAIYSVFYQDGRAATKRLRAILGTNDFGYPKDEIVLGELISAVGHQETPVLDYFAGSGTTAHATIALNREDAGTRRFILVEMGDHYETVLVPRIQKVTYSPDWKDGKPTARDKPISACYQLIQLESYDDTLDNLALRDTPKALDLDLDARRAYTLHYQLNLETRDSLLDLRRFDSPWSYTMKIRRNGTPIDQPIDLVETFHWLLGATVTSYDDHGLQGILFIEATTRENTKLLIIWREFATWNSDRLCALMERLRYSARTNDYDTIYVNGDSHLPIVVGPEGLPKVQLIEDAFFKAMFDTTGER